MRNIINSGMEATKKLQKTVEIFCKHNNNASSSQEESNDDD